MERADRKVANASKKLLMESIQRIRVQPTKKKTEGNAQQGVYNTEDGGK